MTIHHDAVIALLRQILLTRPHLRLEIKSSRERLFTVVARLYVFDELRREVSLDPEEIEQMTDALVGSDPISLSQERLERFIDYVVSASSILIHDEHFRSAVAQALLEAVKVGPD